MVPCTYSNANLVHSMVTNCGRKDLAEDSSSESQMVSNTKMNIGLLIVTFILAYGTLSIAVDTHLFPVTPFCCLTLILCFGQK